MARKTAANKQNRKKTGRPAITKTDMQTNTPLQAAVAEVPGALRFWFLLHFVLDVAFAVPLMLKPRVFLNWAGWHYVDPIAARLVAAALLAIGIESLLGRNDGIRLFKGMLNLKIIWSFAAAAGIAVSIIQHAHNRPMFAYVILGVFIAFNLLWLYWRLRLEKLPNPSASSVPDGKI